ncbi:MAG: efflux RND transporter permease subunit [Campylobacterota bacterium]|nr:efflux RND transporter permease subunit [Campylobacterota bacterium]
MSHHQPSKLEHLIYWIVHNQFNRTMVYLITLILFAISVYLIPLEMVKAKMLPGKDSDSFSIYVDLPLGSSSAQTKEVTSCIAAQLQQEPIVNAISVFLGEGQPLDFAGMVKGSALKSSQNVAEIMINIARANHRDEQSYNFVSRIRPIIQKQCNINNANIKFVELPAGPPVLADVVAEVYGGDSLKSRYALSQKISAILAKQKTLVDIDILYDKPYTKYQLKLDNNKIIKSQVGVDQVKKIIYLAFEGMNVGAVNLGDSENQVPIFLRLDDTRIVENSSKEALKSKLSNLKLMNKQGMMVPLSEFVQIQKTTQEPSITSKNLNHMINVVAQTNKDSQIYPLLDARSMMINTLQEQFIVSNSNLLNLRFVDKKTNEVFDVIFDGELKVTLDTFIELGGAFIGALVLIFLLMVVYYKNFSLAGAIVLSSFISLIGVIAGHLIMDLMTVDTFYLTATSLIGFIGLIGINSRNSLLIIDFTQQLIEQHHMEPNRAIAVATTTRAKPILLTVLAIVFASSLLATDAVFGGLGVALVGGTISAYFVSLFFVPAIIQRPISKLYKD